MKSFILYAAVICLSAFLLFQIQPMIAKMILPWFGGSAAVWITAMLFFQSLLLGGYLYAHRSVRSLSPLFQSIVHIALIAASLFFLPVAPALSLKPSGTEDPVFRITALLAVSVGLPYFLLSSTSPLIQAWYARRHKEALPYRLFGLSNFASLAGLVAYPFLVEPHITLKSQSAAWSAGYVIFAAICAIAATISRRGDLSDICVIESEGEGMADECRPPRMRDQFIWLSLAACASILLLAVTNHLTQNVASIPFLWIVPLSLYLLTFILCFDFERLYNRRIYAWLLSAALAGLAYGLSEWNSRTNLKLVISAFSACLFICCMFCHGELVRRKPSSHYLTSFYLMLSIGGAVGGLLVGMCAPKFLPALFELPVSLIACSLLMLLLLDYRSWRFTIALCWAVAVGVIITSGYYMQQYAQSALAMDRNFYGGLRVHEYDKETENEARSLVHGTVIHGKQFVSPERRQDRITYYSPESGIGLAFGNLRHSPLKVGVIGLGAGSLAAYAEPGDLFRFYEINPLVERFARDHFTFLSDCRGSAEIILGDGRLSLEREPLQRYDLIAVDAFSGDSVPVHLITLQALELYFRHLKPGGIVAFHITNTHLDLAPVLERLRMDLGKHAVQITNEPDSDEEIYQSTWVLVTSEPIGPGAIQEAGQPLLFRSDIQTWTDDFNNLFQILKY